MLSPQGVEGELHDRPAPLPKEGDHLERLPRDVPVRRDRHVPAVLFPADHDDRLRLDPLPVGEVEPEGRLGAEEVPRAAQDVGGDAEEVLLAWIHPFHHLGVEPRGGQQDEAPVVRLRHPDGDRLPGGEQVEAPFHRLGQGKLAGEDVTGPVGDEGQAGGASRQPVRSLVHRPVPADDDHGVGPRKRRLPRHHDGIAGGGRLPDPEREAARRQVRADPVEAVHDLGAGDGVVDHVDHLKRL